MFSMVNSDIFCRLFPPVLYLLLRYLTFYSSLTQLPQDEAQYFSKYDTKLNLVVRLQFYNSGVSGVTLHCHCPLFTSKPRMVVSINIPSLSLTIVLKNVKIIVIFMNK